MHTLNRSPCTRSGADLVHFALQVRGPLWRAGSLLLLLLLVSWGQLSALGHPHVAQQAVPVPVRAPVAGHLGPVQETGCLRIHLLLWLRLGLSLPAPTPA